MCVYYNMIKLLSMFDLLILGQKLASPISPIRFSLTVSPSQNLKETFL